jgi:hypothetical protein
VVYERLIVGGSEVSECARRKIEFADIEIARSRAFTPRASQRFNHVISAAS